MEDTVWKWPHRDELIETNASIFAMMRDIAVSLGRELMTAAEYRALFSQPAKLNAAE
jgi:3-keto-5-aminohexanoate cleavage enzyme